ncbi:MAG: polysaccharide biosynthesis protein [Bacteroidia bacterium]|nr:polysaccharide biosynthesis protein [Bacteroidia bacterium]
MVLLKKNTPSWIVFAFDILICIISLTLAYLLRFNFYMPEIYREPLFFAFPFVVLIRAISFFIGRTHAGIVRYTSTKDAERIVIVILCGSVFFIISNIFSYYFILHKFLIPLSVLLIDFFITVFTMTFSRLLLKTVYLELNYPKKNTSNVIIYGTDELGMITKRTLDRDLGRNHNVIAFIDNSNRNVGKKIEGVTIKNCDKLESILQKQTVSKLIFAKKLIGSARKKEIVETCLNYNVEVLSIPDINKWINGELSVNQIKNIKIEDLLERDPIELDVVQIKKQLINKVILVTGAAGSIGSEIVRQIAGYNPQKILLLDQAESPLYEIEIELKEELKFPNYEIVIGDITNQQKMEWVFDKHRPYIVFHAAAYKHVPMMEGHPAEAIHTNVYGTRVIADLAVKYNVGKFVMISTDKAVNPTNVMGAAKRIAEIYIQSLNNKTTTCFITTRFGNVLGSNGSVIPRFRSQIEKGGPVTVTHPEVTRYFMTIKEACELVLNASVIGKGGEIFIFDMGKPIKIIDLAKKMIRLSGLAVGKDVSLVYTGLRPGEKLYEELLNDKENNLPTPHPEIMIAKVREYDFDEILNKIDTLIEVSQFHNDFEIVRMMKEIIPEYISNNSIFEELDNQNETDPLNKPVISAPKEAEK